MHKNYETSDIGYSYYYWGPQLLKYELDQDLIDELRKDCGDGDVVATDYRSVLAGKINQENDLAKYNAKYTPILGRYVKHYLETIAEHWKPQLFTTLFGDDRPDITYEIVLDSIWANHSRPGEVNPLHRHSGDISFVIYTNIPEGMHTETNNTTSAAPGSIGFWNTLEGQAFYTVDESDRITLPTVNWTCPIGRVEHKPSVGDMFMFPSYLHHEVMPFKSEGIRTSIAGNFTVNAYIKK